MKILNFVAQCVYILLYTILLLAKTVILFWQGLKTMIAYAFAGFIYQITVSLIALFFFKQRVDKLYAHMMSGTVTSQDGANFLMVLFLLFFTVMMINAVVQLFFCIIKQNKLFRTIFNIQRTISTYVMTILSLGALWIASMIRTFEISSSQNFILFIFGTFYFISSVFADCYWYFIMKHERIEKIYQKLRTEVNIIKQDQQVF